MAEKQKSQGKAPEANTVDNSEDKTDTSVKSGNIRNNHKQSLIVGGLLLKSGKTVKVENLKSVTESPVAKQWLKLKVIEIV